MLLTEQPIWRERLQGVGVITAEECLALGVTGPILRSTGYAWDLRRDMPYLAYDQVDFDVIVGSLRRLLRPLRHPPRRDPRVDEDRPPVRRQACPPGDYRVQDKKVTPPPRARIDESMEALIHHFKIFTEGFKVPEGETYVAVESPRGELGCYIVSRRQRRSPTACTSGARPSSTSRACPHLMHGGLVADAVAIISSRRPDHGRGRSLMARLTPENVVLAQRDHRPLPARRSPRSIPLLHLAQEQDGYAHRRRDGPHRRAGRRHPGRGARHVLASTRCSSASPSGATCVNVCTNISCLLLGGEELLDHAEQRLGIRAGSTTADGLFTLEDVECIAACTEAPVPAGELPLLPQGQHRRASTSWSTTCASGARRRGPAARHPRRDPPAHPAGAHGRRRPSPRTASVPVWIAATAAAEEADA